MMIRRLLLPLLLAACALPLLATPDLEVSLDAPATTTPGASYSFSGTVVNRGVDAAEQVRIDMGIGGFEYCHQNTDIGTLQSGERKTFTCATTIPLQPPGYQLSVWFSATTEADPDGANNSASTFALVMTPPDLRTWAYAFTPVAPGLPATMHVYYFNDANTPASPATLKLTTAGTFVDVPWFCTATGGVALCEIGRVERTDPAEAPFFAVTVRAPDVSAVRFDLDIEIGPVAGDPRPENNVFSAPASTFRTFFVTNRANSGSGSLRAAIDAANAGCTDSWPCMIAFRIADAGTPWHTIAVTEPLPVINQPLVAVDGSTQAAYFTDTNAAGPEIELNGSTLASGSGIIISGGCTSSVRGLAINGFSDSAVRVVGTEGCVHFGYPNQPFSWQRSVEKNYIGTDPTGTIAVPNGFGVYVDGTNGSWTVASNVISGNRNSGVFVDAGKNLVTGNIIGLTAGPTAGLGNEASGIYIASRADGTDVVDNYIGFNHHFGIGIAADAENVAILGNSFQANRQLAIDRGLDGVTPTGVPLPEITAAYWDGEATVIEIDPGQVGGTFSPIVQVYANDQLDPSGYGEGQYYLGRAEIFEQDNRKTRLRFGGDLRGLWVAATTTRSVYNGWLTTPGVRSEGDTGWGYYTTTSEFGRAVLVQ